MRLYKQRARTSVVRNVLAVLLFAAFVTAFLVGVNNASRSAERESKHITEQAIRRAMVNCYAIEGAYPLQLSYLEEHYGVQVDHDKYVVTFNSIGKNMMPYVEIIEKGGTYLE